ncbi:IS110 family transposase [Streptomyces sp. ID05-04B]|uniref:IS110 family transposase n=1 Tax=Streptomyces sp. ID05-04B TaxID=3028661 RepID=UPI0029C9D5B7|nr:transposase [Streptomyces sp. ID05-04B]
MTHDGPQITGGVDTHGLTHHAAVIDTVGRHLADREFPATIRGYRDLLDWMRSHGRLVAAGVEGTGAYGAELARVLTAAGVTVIDVDRPDRKTRRMKGKSDPIDAYAAATAVLSGRATGVPKSRDGVVEAVRVLRIARRSAVKARTQAMNQIRDLLVSLWDAALRSEGQSRGGVSASAAAAIPRLTRRLFDAVCRVQDPVGPRRFGGLLLQSLDLLADGSALGRTFLSGAFRQRHRSRVISFPVVDGSAGLGSTHVIFQRPHHPGGCFAVAVRHAA